MQIWAESGKSALPICNYSQILYQFLTFTQNLKRSLKNIHCIHRKYGCRCVYCSTLVYLIVVFVMFFFQPFISSLLWEMLMLIKVCFYVDSTGSRPLLF